MRRSRFLQERLSGIRKAHEARVPASSLHHTPGGRDAGIVKRKACFGGRDAS